MQSGSLERSWTAEVGGASALAAAAITGLGGLLAVAQILSQSAVIPGPVGVLRVGIGLSPAVLGAALPVALLFGTVAAGRRWAEAGDGLALSASGWGARRLIAALLVLGAGAGAVEAGLSHNLEPRGRAEVRRALVAAAGDLSLQAGQPAAVGSVLVFAGEVRGAALGDLFVATDTLVASARAGALEPGGALFLEDGEAASVVRVGGAPDATGWRIRFRTARLPLDVRGRRVESAERSSSDLRDLIERMRARGASVEPETLALYKRTALPLCMPLLALLGLPLGMRGVRPMFAATTTALAWWVLLRICDQAVLTLGPALAAALPPLGLVLATALAWASWRDR